MNRVTSNMTRALQAAISQLVEHGELTADGKLTEIGRSNAAIVGRLFQHDGNYKPTLMVHV